mmetsp:Transcript_20462/g.60898  ORF Transcript_20462/g.60898 Transcript_20462/m.60898 type:complete len:128 (-) Transcript_20462:1062-1445(-)
MLKGSMEGRDPIESIKKSFVDLPENVKACWAVWVPAQLINFSVVPHHLRIPFVALVSFLWTIIISGMRGRLEVKETKPVTMTSEQMSQAVRMPSAPSFASGPVVSATGPTGTGAPHSGHTNVAVTQS